MSWLLHSTLQRLSAVSPMKTAVRFWERRKFIRRYGYEDPIMKPGLFPRNPNSKRPIQALPTYVAKDAWCERRALFGQNDYIDILGDGKIKPLDIMTGVPLWLRGFQGNEFQMLLHKRRVFHSWKFSRPTKHRDLCKRIRFLYKVLNHRTKT
ncbi:large ribosomal subunit protein mL51-like [Ornithodoros turicata]|uniref:large ribosomal subunit protein mL51-like n=1 Tax=Ornithodoros turicata TaxID=34597 RepID=UPI00313A4974